MAKHPDQSKETELRPDAWSRFERAVDAAAKSGPKHKTTRGAARKRKAKKPGR